MRMERSGRPESNSVPYLEGKVKRGLAKPWQALTQAYRRKLWAQFEIGWLQEEGGRDQKSYFALCVAKRVEWRIGGLTNSDRP